MEILLIIIAMALPSFIRGLYLINKYSEVRIKTGAESIYYESIGAFDTFERNGKTINPRAMTRFQFDVHAANCANRKEDGITN